MVRTNQGLLSGCVTRPTQKLLQPGFCLMGLLATASVVLRTSTRKRANHLLGRKRWMHISTNRHGY